MSMENVVSMKEELKKEFYESVIFEYLYASTSELFGDVAARQLIYKIMKDAAKRMTLKVHDLIREVISENPCNWFRFIYSIFDIELASCNIDGNKGELKIRKCTLIQKYKDKAEHSACITMFAIIAGFVEALSGHRVMIESPWGRLGHPRPTLKVKVIKSGVDELNCCHFLVEVVGESG
ncbi:hypothetical protein IPA_05750 [Ignicoccus pacificus DSM 13166]|uniref:Uncharacterized protein n=1 Tax=Ignicoccus pacificus DSM 13166 TaxID=940294 RepID=A0A977PKZ0_9CREN|nr:hypothetical protein IPA_05750 [Ignicoccus pacificus DSM 13166]